MRTYYMELVYDGGDWRRSWVYVFKFYIRAFVSQVRHKDRIPFGLSYHRMRAQQLTRASKIFVLDERFPFS